MTPVDFYPFKLWSRLAKGWQFAICSYLLLRCLYFLWSAVILSFYPLAVKNFDLFGQPVMTVFNLQNSFRAAYDPVVSGHLLAFVPVRGAAGYVGDLQTGSRWDIYTGMAVSGDYVGNKLNFSDYPIERIFPYYGLKPFPSAWMGIWQRFDTNWSISIAERGYGVIPGDIHFPPLYPFLISLFRLVFRDGFVAGMVVSGLAGVMCLKLLYDLFLSWGGDNRSATRGLIYFLVFPASFFLFGAYTEGLFIVAAVLALESLHRSQWIYAAVWVSCATLIRLQGLALFLPLIYFLWQHKSTMSRYRALFCLFIAALGIVAYLVLRAAVPGGDNVIPLAESNLYAHLAFPWDNFVSAFQTLAAGSMTHIDALNLLVALLFLGLIGGGWKHIPIEYSLYSVATYVLLTIRVVDTQPFNSMLRYALTLFPSFYVLGRWGRHPIPHRLILYLSIVLLLFLSAQFWIWGWVA